MNLNTYDYRKIKVIQLTDKQRLPLEEGFRQDKNHTYRMRCRAVLLKASGLTSKEVGLQTEMTHISGKEASESTFRAFLSALVRDTDV